MQYDDGEVEMHVAAHSIQPAEDADFKLESLEQSLPFACQIMSKAATGYQGEAQYADGHAPLPQEEGSSSGAPGSSYDAPY